MLLALTAIQSHMPGSVLTGPAAVISSLVNMRFVAYKVQLVVDFLRIPLFTPTVSFHRYQ
jgi:hypothetical protein